MSAPVSLCLIARNAEGTLTACLTSAADLVHEIILIDTGSTDRTKEVAARFGAHVFDFPWCEDFSTARNESLRHATGEWIFWLDADDRRNAIQGAERPADSEAPVTSVANVNTRMVLAAVVTTKRFILPARPRRASLAGSSPGVAGRLLPYDVEENCQVS